MKPFTLRTAAAFQSRLRARWDSPSSDNGIALLTAMLVMLIVSGISIVIVGLVANLSFTTEIAEKRTVTVNAAQAGIQATLAMFRSATLAPNVVTGAVYGDPSQLPCNVQGTVGGASGAQAYSVTISYSATDPTNTTITQVPLVCTTGLGVRTAAGVTTSPSYATIVSVGSSSAVRSSASVSTGNRSVSTIYKFQTVSVNIPGGLLTINSNFCLHAVSATVGSLVLLYPLAQCTNTALEQWVYDSDWELKLASSLSNDAAGVCITSPTALSGALQQPTVGNITLTTCLQGKRSPLDPNRWNQLWTFTGYASFNVQSNPVSSGTSGYCLAAGLIAVGGYLPLASSTLCATLLPSAAVGAGGASYATHQLLNYQEFSRCADVTGGQINYFFMVSYSCHQDPTAALGTPGDWNQKWYYSEPTAGNPFTAPQQVYVYYLANPAAQYCLTSPGITATSYITFSSCSPTANPTGAQAWVRYGATGDTASSFQIRDANNLCLTANGSDQFVGYSKLTVAPCTTSNSQKWNAPSTSSSSTVSGYKEVG